jgi:PKD repeat protein
MKITSRRGSQILFATVLIISLLCCAVAATEGNITPKISPETAPGSVPVSTPVSTPDITRIPVQTPDPVPEPTQVITPVLPDDTTTTVPDTPLPVPAFAAGDPVPIIKFTTNVSTGYAPLGVRFTDTSTNATTWNWSFGDGTWFNTSAAAQKSPAYRYTAAGTYAAQLIACNAAGCNTTAPVKTITVNLLTPPVEKFISNVSTGYAPLGVKFTDASTGATTWNWSFGDGTWFNTTVSTQKSPAYVYTIPGTFTARLFACNAAGCNTTAPVKTITVNLLTPPVEKFISNVSTGYAPLGVRFTDASTGATTWNWSFGDGTWFNTSAAAQKSPAYRYTAAGTYAAQLITCNAAGCNTTAPVKTITVNLLTPPVEKFISNVSTGYAPLGVKFTDASTGATTWNWSFGDGTWFNTSAAAQKSPAYIYTIPGTFTARLFACNAAGCNTTAPVKTITVNLLTPPIERFISNVSTGYAPLGVKFTDASTGATKWNWSFGDGTWFNTSVATQKSPAYVYTIPGTFTARLFACNAAGCNTTAPVKTITVNLLTPPMVKFITNVSSGNAPLAVRFTDQSTGSPGSWNWSFGDGTWFNTTVSAQKSPSYVYAIPGNYTARQFACNAAGCNTTAPGKVIWAKGSVIIASFTTTPANGIVPLAVQVNDTSSGNPTTWNWSFGDGGFTNTQNATHLYSTGGNFTVRLNASNTNGYSIATRYINVYNTTTSAVSANATSGPAPLAVQFTGSGSNATTFFWLFGDGSNATVQSPVHTYLTGGNYSVNFSASNGHYTNWTNLTGFISVQPAASVPFNATVVLNSMSATMFQGEHYIVDIKVNNTGTETWYADPANTNLVFLQGLGGPSGDAAKFNITHIPMIFTNETVAPGESYDFFFYVQAPDIIGSYAPQYQVSSASSGVFGQVANTTVNVIENPFHPVTQPDGSKLYTTKFGNTSSGVSVNIVGPKVYIEKIHGSSFTDPRYLINPALKSGVFQLELNDSYSYADVSINYDPAKVSTPANLALGYFNRTNGNYTFVNSTVDSVNHKVTSRVTNADLVMSGNSIAALDAVQYHALPVQAQNEMGYMDMGPNDSFTVDIWNMDAFNTFYFANGANFAPGNYTIQASGSYSNINLMGYGCYSGWATADSNPDSWSGMYVVDHDATGVTETQVQNRRIASGVLKINTLGGPVGVYNRHYTNPTCGDVHYRIYYGNGALNRTPGLYTTSLENNEFNMTQLGYDAAVTAYEAALGCVLGQAGKKGSYIEKNLGSLSGYGSFLNDDVTESPAYLFGHVACAIAFPEIAAVRDFSADLYRGDLFGAALNSLGFVGRFKTAFQGAEGTAEIAAFVERNAGNADEAKDFFMSLDRMGISQYFTDGEMYSFMQKTLPPGDLAFVDKFLGEGKISIPRSIQYITSDRGLVNGWVWSEAGRFDALAGNLHEFNPKIDSLVIGKYIAEGQPGYIYSYERVGRVKGANYLNFLSDPGWDVNEQILDLAIYGKNRILCTTDPDLATGGFLLERDYLTANGFVKGDHWTETLNGIPYEFWSMVKV